jgi:signal transduction histidine kinase
MIKWDAQKRHACPRGPGLVVTICATAALGVLIAATLLGLSQADTTGRTLGLDVAVAVLSCGLIPVTLRWPLAGGLALGVLAALSPVATPPATAAALIAARQRRFPVALTVAATGIAGHAIQGWWRPAGGLSYGWWLLLLTAAYAALVGWGALAQARQALLGSLRERALRAEAEQGRRVAEARVAERARIAREMHDVLAHRLTLVATYAGALEYRPDASPEQLSKAAGVVRAGVHQALDELREVITVLREDDNEADPTSRPQPVLADVTCLVDESRAAGTSVRLNNQITTPTEVPAATGRTAYRVVQEALTNARKHATGQPVLVLLEGRPGMGLVVDVRNPLPTNASASPARGAGTGLIGLTERVQLAGGHLDHEISAGEFHLTARLPWPA